MATTVEIGSLITRAPEIRGGRPRIAGTGVRVRRIVSWYQLGLTPEEITREIPHLTLAQVYAALAYYHANRQEIETDLAAEEAEAARLQPVLSSPPQQRYSIGEQLRRLLRLAPPARLKTWSTARSF